MVIYEFQGHFIFSIIKKPRFPRLFFLENHVPLFKKGNWGFEIWVKIFINFQKENQPKRGFVWKITAYIYYAQKYNIMVAFRSIIATSNNQIKNFFLRFQFFLPKNFKIKRFTNRDLETTKKKKLEKYLTRSLQSAPPRIIDLWPQFLVWFF